MNKICGLETDFSFFREDESRMIIGYDLKPIDNNLYEWYEIYIYKKQKSYIDFQCIKDAILGDINGQIDEEILTGFTWDVPSLNGGEGLDSVSVWLSSENQFNYKAAFDLASQTGGQNLPITFKFGSPDEPVYHTFTEFSELQNFYVSAVTFINQTLAAGWQRKDSIDWTPYEELFPTRDPEPSVLIEEEEGE